MDDRQYVQVAPEPDMGFYGTASASDDIMAKRTLYDLTGIDRETWTILGIDIFASGRWDSDDIHVMAVSKEAAAGHEELRALDDREKGVPVTTFVVGGLSERDVISIMKNYTVCLRSQHFPTMYEVDRVETQKPA
jgi:hypothetical protein